MLYGRLIFEAVRKDGEVGGIRICNAETLQIVKEKKESYLKYSNENSLKIITGGNNYFGRRFQICFLKCRNTCVSELGRLEASGDRYKRSAG